MRQWFASVAAAAICLGLAPLLYSASGSSVWSGAGKDNNWSNGANWQGGSSPASGADVTLGSPAFQSVITVDTSPIVNSLTISSAYYIYGANGGTLTISSGGMAVGNSVTYSNSYGYFDSSTSISLAAPQTWTIGSSSGLGYGSLNIYGNITGSSANLLNATVYGSLALGGNNNFSGTVTLANAGNLEVDSDTALGNAALVVNGTSSISSWNGDRIVANAVKLNSGFVNINPYYNSLTLSGPITISSSNESKTTDIYIGGPAPVIFSGAIGESGGHQSIHKLGGGMLVLKGSLGVTGGAYVDEGLVIIGSATAMPAAEVPIAVYGDGYLGFDAATGIAAAGFVNRLDPASSGTIGFDTATPASPAIISDPIDLSRFNSATPPRLGSATNARLTGLITPTGGSYDFGGGGGTLEVASNLTGENNLNLYSPGTQSLTLILSGENSYSGSTQIENSLLRFANPAALTGLSGNFFFSNRGYLGLDFTPTASLLAQLGPKIAFEGATVILGLDSPNPAAPNTLTISSDTLSYFQSGAFLGTSTSATVGISKGDSSLPSTLAFAAIKDGHLNVSSLPAGEYSVIVGLPNDYLNTANNDYTYASRTRGTFATEASTVTLQNASGYSGGTILQGGRLELGNSHALGTGALAVTGSAVLATTGESLNIANDLVTSGSLPSDATFSGNLTLDSTNSFTLSGTISGGGQITEIGAGSVKLTGANPLFSGDFTVSEGTLDVGNDSALSAALLNVYGTANFLTAAPSVGSLNGEGTVNLNSAVLTINGNGSGIFWGPIGGTGGLVLNSGNLSLRGDNTYSGGTTINGSALYPTTLIAGSSAALGTGPVSVLGGSLYLNNNATLTNPLTFGSGTIGGLGTFAPAGGVVIGPSQTVVPGISNNFTGDIYNTAIGTLTFGTGLTLASGGTWQWELGNASGVAGTGWDELLVTGTLTITSTPGAPFYLTISPVDIESPYTGPRVFNNSQSYSWTIASASGGITGFDPNAISLDSSRFASLLGTGQFFLTQTGNDLFLNFSPVPEPSTYALMGLGLSVVLVGLRRRKRPAG